MSLLMRRRGLMKVASVVDAILVTMTPTAGFTVGFNLTFTGSVYIDFKDGGGKEALTSGVEKTHLYSSAGTYIAEITGDLTNITKFIADQCSIKFIENFKTGLLTDLQLQNNVYEGILDITQARVKTKVLIFGNVLLTDILFATSGNELVSDLRVYDCDISVLKLSNVPVATLLFAYRNYNMTDIEFSISGNGIMLDIECADCDIRSLDMTNVRVGSSTNATLIFDRNINLYEVLFASVGNGALKTYRFDSCNLGYIDLISGGQNMSVNTNNLDFRNNNMTAAEVNHMLVDLYTLVSDEGSGGDYTGRQIKMDGTNAAPDGTSGGYDGLTAKANLISKGITVTTN